LSLELDSFKMYFTQIKVMIAILEFVVTLPTGVAPKSCDEYVCVSVCLSVREDISGTTRAILTSFPVHVVYGRGLVLLRQGGEIRRGRGNFGDFPPHGQCIVTHSLQKGSFNLQ